MRWFQLDSDAPADPRMAVVIRDLGNEGFGGLVRLWCHIANHGERRPGYSLTSTGKPMSRFELVMATGLTEAMFDRLVAICVETGHFSAREWNARKVIAIPAMSKRADTYTKRNVRTKFAQGSNNVRLQDSTRQDTTNKKNPPTPLSRGALVTRAHKKHAEDVLKMRFGRCPHESPCENRHVCVAALAQDFANRQAEATA